MYLDYKFEWYFLYDSEKHLKTASFVAVFGLVGAMGTLYNYTLQKVTQEKINDKKLVAEIIAKSRIEWLREMREHVSTYMSLANQASFYLETHWDSLASKEKSLEHLNVYNAIVKDVDIYYYKILFNLNHKEKIHFKIERYSNIFNIRFLDSLINITLEKIEKIDDEKNNWVEIMSTYVDGTIRKDGINKRIKAIMIEREVLDASKSVSNYRKHIQSQVGKSIQIYFKKEWDKAKEEIRSGEVAPADLQEK